MNEPLAISRRQRRRGRLHRGLSVGPPRDPRFHEVTVELSAEMLVLGRIASDLADGARRSNMQFRQAGRRTIFQRMVAALGGPHDLVERPRQHLRSAPVIRAVHPERHGIVQRIGTRDTGVAVVALGGGRTRPQDRGQSRGRSDRSCRHWRRVDHERPLGIVHARTEEEADAAARALETRLQLGDGTC